MILLLNKYFKKLIKKKKQKLIGAHICLPNNTPRKTLLKKNKC